MCGLAGIVAADGVPLDGLHAMARALAHRGPDGEGFCLYHQDGGLTVRRTLEGRHGRDHGATAGLAHRRLSVIDVGESSDQPMLSADGQLAIAYNGELYNYIELRAELEGLGHRFRSQGDTEVVLGAYAQWGPSCVHRFVGMWALAILDLQRRSLFLSRDRFGVKPLFWCPIGAGLAFASEIKGLLALPAVPCEPEPRTLLRYLLTGVVDDRELSFFSGIRRLEPGTNATIDLDSKRPADTLRINRWWTLPAGRFDGDATEAAEAFADRLRAAVDMHLRSDVAVGTCLSGGLDSSAIVCLGARLRADGRHASYRHVGFGYVPEDPASSERYWMDLVAGQSQLDLHHVMVSDEEMAATIPEVVALQDEPFSSASIAAQWFVFRAAREADIKVVLDGQGADEVLGGYHTYLGLRGLALLAERRRLGYARFAVAHRRRYGRLPQSSEAILGALGPEAAVRAYRALRARRPAPAAVETVAVEEAIDPRLAGLGRLEDGQTPQSGDIDAMLRAHTEAINLPQLLRYEDRNSMAHSIEARVPFLDHRLVELAFSLPLDTKVRGVTTKWVLREGMRGILPEPVRKRADKIGFKADPRVTWDLVERGGEDLEGERTDAERDWFDAEGVQRVLRAPRTPANEFTAWRVVNAKLWLRRHWG